MMASFLGSAQQTLQTLFLVRYLVIQPAWAALKTAAYPILSTLLSLLAELGNRDLPFD